jgi:hypothetical protein
MTRVFISGYVSEAALRSAVHGAVVRASTPAGGDQFRWEGATDNSGRFGFELQSDDHPDALAIEVNVGGASVGRRELAWQDLMAVGAHVDFVVEAHRSNGAGKPTAFPFPIGFHAAIPPPLERPNDVPTHPMMALPFLVQRSYPRDPAEEERVIEMVAPRAPRLSLDPP